MPTLRRRRLKTILLATSVAAMVGAVISLCLPPSADAFKVLILIGVPTLTGLLLALGPSLLDSSTASSHVPLPLSRTAACGIGWSIASTIPLAALIALFFRFPFPLSGYLSGPSAMIPAMIAVFFYGVLMGGLVIVGIGGGLAGILAGSVTNNPTWQIQLTRLLSVVVSFLLLLLVTLDLIR